MTYTVENLITDAYYTSGIVSQEFETVDGNKLSKGIIDLNFILSDKTSDKKMIPYYTPYQFVTVAGQEEYFIPNCVTIETMTFYIGTIRYSMRPNGRITYFGDPRADQILSLPFNYHAERVFNTNVVPPVSGSNVYMYFFPNDAYNTYIWGLFSLSDVNFNDDLQLILDGFYIDYLKFRLAKRLCNTWNFSVSQGIKEELQEAEDSIMSRSGVMDLRLQVMSTLGSYNNGVNYALSNLGKGWTTT